MSCVSRERPVAWGKLPAFADFVRIGSPAKHASAWIGWFDAFPISSFGSLVQRDGPRASLKETPDIDWHTLEPREWIEKPHLHPLPWSFILPAHVFQFSANDLVVGAMTQSCDKVGRRHPFVIYQVVPPAWIKRHLRDARGPLFWWARSLAQHTPPVANAPGADAVLGLDAQIERLGGLYKRHWWQAFGAPRMPDARACRDVVGDSFAHDPANALQGVTAPPWADWPNPAPVNVATARFWQQDDTGRYVGMKEIDLSALADGEGSFR